MKFTLSQSTLDLYIKRRREDLETLRQALSRQDYIEIENIAHQIKGNAATFGFDDLGTRAQLLEKFALEKDATSLSAEIQWLAHWLEKRTN